MAKTIKELKSELEVLEKQYDDAISAIRKDPAFVRATKMRNKALTAAHKKHNSKTILEKMGDMRDAIVQARREKKEEEESVIPAHIRQFLENYQEGFTTLNLKVRWISPSERFFILTERGGNYWSGRGEQSYSPSLHYLMDSSKASDNSGCIRIRNACEVSKCEGRLTQTTKHEWIATVEEMERKKKK